MMIVNAINKISVCMATYNGELWIGKQINSILKQIGINDEIIIVDDCSTDATVSIIKAFSDNRIKLFVNSINMGVNYSFEAALNKAVGEIIFLSDQDDIWYDNKSKTILKSFIEDTQLTLIVSEADIINEFDVVQKNTYFSTRGPFIHGVIPNLLKSKFLGCAMAFRSSLLKYVLPFPKQMPGHDMWIGLVNEYYGKSKFIPTPLIAYRRHDKNASPYKRQSILKMLIWRYQLISGLLQRIAMIFFTQFK